MNLMLNAASKFTLWSMKIELQNLASVANVLSIRSFSGNRPKNTEDDYMQTRISVTDDGNTIVCWHPPKSFPYKHSLPYEEEDHIAASSPFKPEHVISGINIHYKGPATRNSIEELQAITYTPKHVWRRRRFDGIQMRPDHPRKGV